MDTAFIFSTSPRQNRALVYQLVAILLSWGLCYLTKYGFGSFGVFLITSVLTSTALVYSNKAFLKYKVSHCNYLAIVLILFCLLLAGMIESFDLTDDYIIDTLYSYVVITAVIKSTQKQVSIRLVQLATGGELLLIYFLFIYHKLSFRYEERSTVYYIPFFFNQLFAGIYAISLLTPAEEEPLQEFDEENSIVDVPKLPKKKNDIFGFTVIVITASGILIVVFVLISAVRLNQPSHPKNELIADFEANPDLFYDIRNYVNKVDPEHKIHEIEFDIVRNKSFWIAINGVGSDNGYHDMESWMPPDSLLRATPWTKQTLTVLKEKLDKINCRSVKTGDPFIIGHNTIDSQEFYYNLFSQRIYNLSYPFNDTCRYAWYNEHVILEFRHISDFDSECFPN